MSACAPACIVRGVLVKCASDVPRHNKSAALRRRFCSATKKISWCRLCRSYPLCPSYRRCHRRPEELARFGCDGDAHHDWLRRPRTQCRLQSRVRLLLRHYPTRRPSQQPNLVRLCLIHCFAADSGVPVPDPLPVLARTLAQPGQLPITQQVACSSRAAPKDSYARSVAQTDGCGGDIRDACGDRRS